MSRDAFIRPPPSLFHFGGEILHLPLVCVTMSFCCTLLPTECGVASMQMSGCSSCPLRDGTRCGETHRAERISTARVFILSAAKKFLSLKISPESECARSHSHKRQTTAAQTKGEIKKKVAERNKVAATATASQQASIRFSIVFVSRLLRLSCSQREIRAFWQQTKNCCEQTNNRCKRRMNGF